MNTAEVKNIARGLVGWGTTPDFLNELTIIVNSLRKSRAGRSQDVFFAEHVFSHHIKKYFPRNSAVPRKILMSDLVRTLIHFISTEEREKACSKSKTNNNNILTPIE